MSIKINKQGEEYISIQGYDEKTISECLLKELQELVDIYYKEDFDKLCAEFPIKVGHVSTFLEERSLLLGGSGKLKVEDNNIATPEHVWRFCCLRGTLPKFKEQAKEISDFTINQIIEFCCAAKAKRVNEIGNQTVISGFGNLPVVKQFNNVVLGFLDNKIYPKLYIVKVWEEELVNDLLCEISFRHEYGGVGI